MSRMKTVYLIKENHGSHPVGVTLLVENSEHAADVQVRTLKSSGKVNYGKKETKEKLDEIVEEAKAKGAELIILLTDKHRKLFEKYDNFEIANGISRSEVTSYIKRFEGRARKDNQYEIVELPDRLNDIWAYARQTGVFAFDFETTGLEVFHEDKITMLAVSVQPGYSYIIPVMEHFAKGFPRAEIFKWLGYVAADEQVEKIAHNLDFELSVCQVAGMRKFKGVWHDTMIQAHLLDEVRGQGLKSLVARFIPEYAGYDKALGNKDWAKIECDTLAKYAALDSDLTLRLFFYFTEQLLEDKYLYPHYRSLDMPARMELSQATGRGLELNVDYLREMSEKGEEDLKQLEKEIKQIPEVRRFEQFKKESLREEALAEYTEKRKKHKKGSHWHGHWTEKINGIKTREEDIEYEWSPGNTDHVSEALYNPKGFGLTPNKDRDGKPDYTSDKYFLYETDNEFSHKVIHYRTIYKMVNTYYKPLIRLADEKNRVHGKFRSNGTVTGRLSSANPNLQNMPSRMLFPADKPLEYVEGIKKAFITPGEEWIYSQADYSQAELRMIANFSGDPNMIEVYRKGLDIHAMTGAMLAQMTYEEFKDHPEYKPYRQKAKSANFGIVYDISPQGYMDYVFKNTGVKISYKEAERTIALFFRQYPVLKMWHKEYEQKVKKQGYVRTIFGRKRRLKYLLSANEYAAIRAAINSPIQGSSGEYALFCIGVLGKILDRQTAQFVNTVHDSLFHYLRRDMFGVNVKLIKYVCENPPLGTYFKIPKQQVPMKMDFEFSEKNWKEMEECEDLNEAIAKFQKEPEAWTAN